MCIAKSVGRNAATDANKRDDVRTVQILLNLNLHKLVPLRELKEDGGIGPMTIGAIEAFQQRVVRMIHASEATVARYFPALNQKMTENEINTALRRAHFLAQLGHESVEFRHTEEIASGEAYEGRADLGNTQTGDGKRFKGRGLIQLTGRANYKAYGDAVGQDFTTDDGAKKISSDPSLAVDVACWFWKAHQLNKLADADDVKEITKKINGGLNGFEDRKAKLVRAKFFLSL